MLALNAGKMCLISAMSGREVQWRWVCFKYGHRYCELPVSQRLYVAYSYSLLMQCKHWHWRFVVCLRALRRIYIVPERNCTNVFVHGSCLNNSFLLKSRTR